MNSYINQQQQNLGNLDNPGNTPQVISINGATYTYDYLLSGADGEFYIWYTANGITIRSMDGSQEITFVKTSEGTYEIPA